MLSIENMVPVNMSYFFVVAVVAEHWKICYYFYRDPFSWSVWSGMWVEKTLSDIQTEMRCLRQIVVKKYADKKVVAATTVVAKKFDVIYLHTYFCA